MPTSFGDLIGTTEVVPFPIYERKALAPDVHHGP
jgi:hypothetical protein